MSVPQPILFADAALARRLARVEAALACDAAETISRIEPETNAGWRPFAGGVAAICGVHSHFTQIQGAGFEGEVLAHELDEVERLFHAAGARVKIELSPHADPSFLALLRRRPYHTLFFKSVLVRPLPGDLPLPSPPESIAVEEATGDTSPVACDVIARGFTDDGASDPLNLQARRLRAASGLSATFLARRAGEPAGGGSMAMIDRCCALFGASTLPGHRAHGVHTAVLVERLRRAIAAGCDIATISAAPGSPSQRNAERLGFRLVDVRPMLVREWQPA